MKFEPWFYPDISKKEHIYPLVLPALLLLLGYLVSVFAFPSLVPDSGFYLKIAHDLAKGASFFADMNCSYAPMSMYILSIPFYICENVGLEFLFAYFFLVYGALGVVFYKVLEHFTDQRRTSLVFTLLLIALNFELEGFHILLEPYVVLFQLSALWVFLKGKTKKHYLFASGALVFFAFFAKQYGLFVLPGMFFLIWTKRNKLISVVRLLMLMAGFVIPLFLFTAYFSLVKGIGVNDFVNQLFGVAVLEGHELITGIDYSVPKLIRQLGQFLLKFPFALAIPYYFLCGERKALTEKSRFGLLLLVGSLSPLYFDYYDHYFQLCAPYTIIALLSFPKRWLKKQLKFFPLMFQIFIGVSSYKLYTAFLHKRALYFEQSTNVPVLTSQLPSGTKVYLHGISPAYYFLCRYDSPNPEILGYKFSVELSLDLIARNMPENSYMIIEPEYLQYKELKGFQRITKIAIEGEYGDMFKKKNVLILKKK